MLQNKKASLGTYAVGLMNNIAAYKSYLAMAVTAFVGSTLVMQRLVQVMSATGASPPMVVVTGVVAFVTAGVMALSFIAILNMQYKLNKWYEELNNTRQSIANINQELASLGVATNYATNLFH